MVERALRQGVLDGRGRHSVHPARRSFLAAGAAAAALLAAGDCLPGAGAATPARDPAIIGSYGGLVVPATGCWFGADDTTRGFTTATGIETQLGRRMAIRNRRYGWLTPCPSPKAVADAALTNPRVVVMCSFGQPASSVGERPFYGLTLS